jgi:hypothetical protein
MAKEIVSTHSHIQWDITQPYERGYCHFNNLGKLGGHYAKWNNPDRGRKVLYDLTCMQNLILKKLKT